MSQTTKTSNGFGITSLVTSIVGLIGFIVPYFAIFFSVTAIIFSVLQTKRNASGMATAGMVLGILGIISNAFWLLIVAIALLMTPVM